MVKVAVEEKMIYTFFGIVTEVALRGGAMYDSANLLTRSQTILKSSPHKGFNFGAVLLVAQNFFHGMVVSPKVEVSATCASNIFWKN